MARWMIGSERTRRLLIKLGGTAAAIAGCALLLASLVQQWPRLTALLGEAQITLLVPAALAAAAMLATSAVTFGFLVHPPGSSPQATLRSAFIYLIAQVYKYLPGRIWGFAFQVAALREEIGTRQAVAAGLTHLLLTALCSVLVFGAAVGIGPTAPAIGLGLAVLWVWRGGAGRYLGIGPQANSGLQTLRIALTILVEWAFFLLAATCIGRAIGLEQGFLAVGAVYAAAWLLGSLVAVAPGGIGVREGGFVAFCQIIDLPPETALGFAIMARFVFSIGELVTAMAAWISMRPRKPSAHPPAGVREYWDSLATRAGSAAAIDPRDTLGHKNRYIGLVRDVALISAFESLPEDSVLLDFGCGTGTFLTNFRRTRPKCHGYGLDISGAMLRAALATDAASRGTFVLFDGRDLPARNATIDALATSGALLYLTADDALSHICREFKRVLKPGGLIACVEQVRATPFLDNVNCKLQRTPDDLISMFTAAGLQLVEWRQLRRGRFPLIYLIRYGLLPRRLHASLARFESRWWRTRPLPAVDYADALFVFRKPA